MADAKQCDICGKLYEKYEHEFAGNKINSISYNREIWDITGKGYMRKETYDCCPDCLKSVIGYITDLALHRLKYVKEESEDGRK